MSGFTGSFHVAVLATGAIPLPPAWHLAAIAADPGGDPGPNLIIFDNGQGGFRAVTPDQHRRLLIDTRRMPAQDPRRQAMEHQLFTEAFAVAMTPDGSLPGSDAFDRRAGFDAGRIVRLRGTGAGFDVEPDGAA